MLHRVVFTHSNVAEESIVVDYQKVSGVQKEDASEEFRRWVIQMGMVNPTATGEILDMFGDEICEHLFDLIASEGDSGP